MDGNGLIKIDFLRAPAMHVDLFITIDHFRSVAVNGVELVAVDFLSAILSHLFVFVVLHFGELINYEGAYISYYDLVYNFAKITQNHTNTQHMGFDSEYEFEKTNDSILLHVFPIILVIIVLYIAYSIWKRLRRH